MGDAKRYYTIDFLVMKKAGLTVTQWLLLELIHYRQAITENGYCDDSREELANGLDLKAGTLKNIISQLVKSGYLKRNSKNHIKTTPKWHKLQSLNGKDLDSLEGSFQNDGSKKRGHSKMTVGSFQNDGKGHSKMTALLYNREKEEKEEKEEILPQILKDWIEYRKQIKKPIKDITIQKLLKEYNQNPPLFEQKVNYSIANGYQGLFAPKKTSLSVADKNKATYEQIKNEYTGGIFDAI